MGVKDKRRTVDPLAILTLMALAVAPKYAVPDATVAYQGYGCEEYEAADGAGLSLQEESDQVEDYEHHVRFHQGRIRGFRYQ